MWLGRSSEASAVYVAIGRGRRKRKGNPEDEDERDGNDIVRREFVLHGHKLEIACEGCLRSQGSVMSVVMIPFPAKVTLTPRPAWVGWVNDYVLSERLQCGAGHPSPRQWLNSIVYSNLTYHNPICFLRN
jgi:hypothetical protein